MPPLQGLDLGRPAIHARRLAGRAELTQPSARGIFHKLFLAGGTKFLWRLDRFIAQPRPAHLIRFSDLPVQGIVRLNTLAKTAGHGR